MLTAPLPSAPEVGPGWRGVELRRAHPLDQLDRIVIETAHRVGAAIGVAESGEAFGYVIAVADGDDPVRAIVGGEAAAGAAADALLGAGLAGQETLFEPAAVAAALASWSEHAPSRVSATSLEPFLGQGVPVDQALAGILGALHIALPIEPIPDPLDLQNLARGGNGDDAPQTVRAKRRWFSRGG